MHSLIKTLTGIAAAAVLGAVLMAGSSRLASAQAPAAPQAAQPAQPADQPAAKKPKDTGEADIANAVFIDMQSNPPNWQKAVTDLDTWIQKYPESDWKNERPMYYLQSYNGLGQKDKALGYSAQLLALDVPNVFKDPSDVLKIYYVTANAVDGIKNATPDQLATGDKGAKALLAFLPTYFTDANKPKGHTDAEWTGLRANLDALGKEAELFVATYAGDQAAAKKDWPAAEAAYRIALKAYPDSWSISYSLGLAILQQKNPATFPQGLYFVARATAMDPAKGGIPDPTKRTAIDTFLKNAYVGFHGGDDGLAELKTLALTSAFPAPDFKIKNTAEIAAEKQKEYQDKYPEVAQWLAIKGMLAGTDGDANFESMKGSLVKGLKGQIMSGSPDCRSKSLLVAVPVPGSTATLTAEITLKLGTYNGDKFVEKPLAGKPVAGTEIKFEGSPTAFTKEPLMVTMNADTDAIQGMATDPCTPPVTKKAAPKPGVAKKKAQ